jgi:hypothetical protein
MAADHTHSVFALLSSKPGKAMAGIPMLNPSTRIVSNG